jgi:four helix bundle protein
MNTHNFLELKVWQKSMTLSKALFIMTKSFPKDEKFGLISQINRAGVSIPSNIAEGTSRNSNKDFSRFLQISLGSCFEIETQLILAKDFEYISVEKAKELISLVKEVQKMIKGFMYTLQ